MAFDNNKLGELRPNQIITTFGPGSVVDAVYPEDVEKFILPPQVEFDYDRVTTAWEMISEADSLKTEACQLLLQQMEQ